MVTVDVRSGSSGTCVWPGAPSLTFIAVISFTVLPTIHLSRSAICSNHSLPIPDTLFMLYSSPSSVLVLKFPSLSVSNLPLLSNSTPVWAVSITTLTTLSFLSNATAADVVSTWALGPLSPSASVELSIEVTEPSPIFTMSSPCGNLSPAAPPWLSGGVCSGGTSLLHPTTMETIKIITKNTEKSFFISLPLHT